MILRLLWHFHLMVAVLTFWTLTLLTLASDDVTVFGRPVTLGVLVPASGSRSLDLNLGNRIVYRAVTKVFINMVTNITSLRRFLIEWHVLACLNEFLSIL